MVNQVQDRILNEVMEALTENGTDGFAQALTRLRQMYGSFGVKRGVAIA